FPNPGSAPSPAFPASQLILPQQILVQQIPGPSSADPSSADPSSAGPSSADPSSADPSSADPSWAGPSSADPSSADPSSADPSSAEPSSAEPSSAEPSSADPSWAGPSSADPSSADPSSADPSWAGPNPRAEKPPGSQVSAPPHPGRWDPLAGLVPGHPSTSVAPCHHCHHCRGHNSFIWGSSIPEGRGNPTGGFGSPVPWWGGRAVWGLFGLSPLSWPAGSEGTVSPLSLHWPGAGV
uniref:Uncharacterized protein n=1 Tax=Ficedula albicollis TaxID=59894 RepID=A0A803VUC5_FICAL